MNFINYQLFISDYFKHGVFGKVFNHPLVEIQNICDGVHQTLSSDKCNYLKWPTFDNIESIIRVLC